MAGTRTLVSQSIFGKFFLVSGVSILISIVFFFLGTFLLPSQAQTFATIDTDMLWTDQQTVEVPTLVAEGATLTIGSGSKIHFRDQGFLLVQGDLDVRGTPNRPVTFTSSENSPYGILVRGSARIHHADISGGGRYDDAPVLMYSPFIKTALAQVSDNKDGVIAVERGANVSISDTKFHDNELVLSCESSFPGSSGWDITLVRSSFENNDHDIYCLDNNNASNIDLRYNWWGSEVAPGLERVVGEALINPHRTKRDFRDPVIILPGTLGSAERKDAEGERVWVPDPILGTYDSLIEVFEKNGYTEGEDLFSLGYDWRKSNVETAQLLKEKVEEITDDSWPWVDIVAHSMGGLVARAYIADSEYGGRVDQLVTLGTPHRGAPKSYLAWQNGDLCLSIDELRCQLLSIGLFYESLKKGHSSRFSYIREDIPSVRELLPVYDYLQDKDDLEFRTYGTDPYPENPFLEELNTTASLNTLKDVVFTNVIGSSQNDTISGFRVEDASISTLDPDTYDEWEYGKPDGYNDILGDRGIMYTDFLKGDGTVPEVSSTAVDADEVIFSPVGHRQLPGALANDAYKGVTGQDPEHPIEDAEEAWDMTAFFVYSPVDIMLTFEDGTVVTAESYEHVDGAYGYQDEQNDMEYIVLRNIDAQSITVEAKPTGVGAYEVQAVRFVQQDPTEEVQESEVILGGVAKESETETFVLEQNEEGEIEEVTSDTTPPTTSLTLSGVEGEGGWFRGEVTATLEADDEGGSGVETTRYSLDGGTTWSEYDGPVEFSAEGEYVLSFQSTDMAGNREEVQTRIFGIDTTHPEVRISFDHHAKILAFAGSDTISTPENIRKDTEDFTQEKTITVPCRNIPWWKRWRAKPCEKTITQDITRTTLTDEAGNATMLVWETVRERKGMIHIIPRSVSYGETTYPLRGNSIKYLWREHWRNADPRWVIASLRAEASFGIGLYQSGREETKLWIYPDENGDTAHSTESGITLPVFETARGVSVVR